MTPHFLDIVFLELMIWLEAFYRCLVEDSLPSCKKGESAG